MVSIRWHWSIFGNLIKIFWVKIWQSFVKWRINIITYLWCTLCLELALLRDFHSCCAVGIFGSFAFSAFLFCHAFGDVTPQKIINPRWKKTWFTTERTLFWQAQEQAAPCDLDDCGWVMSSMISSGYISRDISHHLQRNSRLKIKTAPNFGCTNNGGYQ